MQDWPVISARRFELFVRWSLYILMCMLPVQMAAMVAGAASSAPALRGAIGCFVLSLVVTAFNIAVAKWGLDRVMRRARPVPTWFVVCWVLAVLASTASLLIFVGGFPDGVVIAVFPTICAVSAVSPALTAKRTGIVSLVGLAVAAVIAVFWAPGVLIAYLFFLWIVWSSWSSGWMLRVLRQLQEAHETRAQLTLAEERLRISRDLHDVFGRTLATISVKSELAAELSRRGHHDRAAEEMAQIRSIANTAGAEVRRVVRGVRRASWADEVEGARALLASAGIRCVIAGEDVPEEHAETLAWVIREGITNVLRHSRATQVSLTTAVEDDEVALTLTNDGASSPSATPSSGTGLRSMAGRLQAVGGTLEHERDGDWFLLTASIPISQEVPA